MGASFVSSLSPDERSVIANVSLNGSCRIRKTKTLVAITRNAKQSQRDSFHFAFYFPSVSLTLFTLLIMIYIKYLSLVSVSRKPRTGDFPVGFFFSLFVIIKKQAPCSVCTMDANSLMKWSICSEDNKKGVAGG